MQIVTLDNIIYVFGLKGGIEDTATGRIAKRYFDGRDQVAPHTLAGRAYGLPSFTEGDCQRLANLAKVHPSKLFVVSKVVTMTTDKAGILDALPNNVLIPAEWMAMTGAQTPIWLGTSGQKDRQFLALMKRHHAAQGPTTLVVNGCDALPVPLLLSLEKMGFETLVLTAQFEQADGGRSVIDRLCALLCGRSLFMGETDRLESMAAVAEKTGLISLLSKGA